MNEHVVVTTLLIIMCAVLIAFISYSFGRTMKSHEDKLADLSDDIDRHEREIVHIDETLIKHMNKDAKK